MTTGIVLSPASPTVFLTSSNLVLGFESGVSLGTFRFLKDHWVDEDYILAGDVKEMFTFWVPTADVEPLDTTAVNAFYSAGPKLGAVIRSQFTNRPIAPPITYWRALSPNLWALTGLGAAKAPISAAISRVEDKEP
jgi:hypothetical protein